MIFTQFINLWILGSGIQEWALAQVTTHKAWVAILTNMVKYNPTLENAFCIETVLENSNLFKTFSYSPKTVCVCLYAAPFKTSRSSRREASFQCGTASPQRGWRLYLVTPCPQGVSMGTLATVPSDFNNYKLQVATSRFPCSRKSLWRKTHVWYLELF